jgi:phospholipid N-methyltransferase
MYWEFFQEFTRCSKSVGAVTPSSCSLAQRIVPNGNISSASVVAEYGPGTGAFTSEILGRMGPNTHFFAVENNPRLATFFRRRFPDVMLFEVSAEHAPQILRALGKSHVDCIVSGLPWALFGSKLQDNLLQTTVSLLRKGGTFAAVVYLHSFRADCSEKSSRSVSRKSPDLLSFGGTCPPHLCMNVLDNETGET